MLAWQMSSPSSPMQVATSVLKAPALKSASTWRCSFWLMPTLPFLPLLL